VIVVEDHAWVIEYLPMGHSSQLKREAIVQLVGERFFTLLEANVKPNATIVLGQRVYVGKDERPEIDHIKGRIPYERVTGSAREFLPLAIRKIVEAREKDFVSFINNARPISIRVHTLDFLPGIGKKNMEGLLREREAKPFESFADIKARVPSLSDPASVFIHRITSELEGKEKQAIFVKPPFVPQGRY
jgi:putative nucleotide binding protein